MISRGNKMKFAKYHGLGNDFIIMKSGNYDYSQVAINLCDRHIGVGADGLIVVYQEPLTMRFFNMDGSEGTMCGNGLRCFGEYCYQNKLVSSDSFDVYTKAGVKSLERIADGLWKSNLGKPSYSSDLMDIKTPQSDFLNQSIMGMRVSAVHTGTTHIVTFVLNIDSEQVLEMGPKLSEYPLFSKQANINFVQVMDRNHFKIRTYERGVGWTLACGTGAAASFIIGKSKDYCADKVKIQVLLGEMLLEQNEQEEILLTAPAEKICEGEF
jgi:diaminopimelate epimerase